VSDGDNNRQQTTAAAAAAATDVTTPVAIDRYVRAVAAIIHRRRCGRDVTPGTCLRSPRHGNDPTCVLVAAMTQNQTSTQP